MFLDKVHRDQVINKTPMNSFITENQIELLAVCIIKWFPRCLEMRNDNVSVNDNETVFLHSFWRIQLTSNEEMGCDGSKCHLQRKLTLELMKWY